MKRRRRVEPAKAESPVKARLPRDLARHFEACRKANERALRELAKH